jgi:hypothetical protein
VDLGGDGGGGFGGRGERSVGREAGGEVWGLVCSGSVGDGKIWVADIFPVRDLNYEMGLVFAFSLLETV